MSPFTENLKKRLSEGKHTKLCFFGSSNTERINFGMHWSDCLDLTLRQEYGRFHRSFQMGVGGETTRGLLTRLERDVLELKPHFVFITIGGNDSNPEQEMSSVEFKDNLQKLVTTMKQNKIQVCLQTYYEILEKQMTTAHYKKFIEFMQLIRDVSSENNCFLIDQLPNWQKLYQKDKTEYINLMEDPMHLNPKGNLLFGLELCRQLTIPVDNNSYWNETKQLQKRMLES